MKIIKNKLNIGIDKPFTFIHVSDTHIALADERDNKRKNELAADRKKGFPLAEEQLNEIENYAVKNKYTVVHTGDLIDFVSYKNLDRAKEFYDNTDCIMVSGNHEFSQYVGEAWEDADYRNQSLPQVQRAFKNDIRSFSKVINGVNFVCLDDGYYLFDNEHLEFLKNEVNKGLPIILCMHVPLYEEDLFKQRMKISECAYLTAVPKELMKDYPEYRFRQQLADETTLKTVDYIKKQSLIKAILCGHLHDDFESTVNAKPQFITGIGTIREIFIK